MVNEFTASIVASVPGVVAVVELFTRLPLMGEIRKLQRTMGKSVKVVSSSRISDHWKEKATQRYSRTILTSSCLLFFYLVLLLVIFCIGYGLVSLLLFEHMEGALDQLLQIKVQFIIIAIGMVYVLLRKRFLND